MPKKRLDQLLQELLPTYSRQQIQSWIMQGKIKVNGAVITKPGNATPDDAKIEYDIQEPKYVSRAGFKLEKALDEFNIDVTGLTVLDAGLSTGGFADCLLQRGAAKIYGIDVGYGQAHEKIRADSRVIVMERTNLRDLHDLGQQVDLVTLDLSFISVLKVMDAIDHLLKSDGKLIVLVKPQFEAQKHEVGKGGIVRDDAIREQVVKQVVNGIALHGYQLQGLVESPITGTDGNREFLAYFLKNNATVKQ
ncbi:MAG: TlyA family RNA methyltransferase [Candidatus Dependentiae bacterium]|nr:TlyA family RNA methyltransferase [Candidatus Dependentiae bacterium]